MAEYGIPYMGSKDKIMHQFAHLFPKAENFYDLFGGGFSVTHYMLQRRCRDYQHFHFNEMREGICELIQKAIRGEYSHKHFKIPWVSREYFFEKVDTYPFVKILWSFGNNGQAYLFSKEIEPYKKSMHMCVVFGVFDDISKTVTGMDQWPENTSLYRRRIFIRNRIEYFRKTKIPEILHQFLKEEQLQQLERLIFYTGSYKDVPIKKNSIIYCDIPYQGTASYGDFSHRDFFDWASSQKQPVLISEYAIDDSRFNLVKEIPTKSRLSGSGPVKAVERLYVNHAGKINHGQTSY
jgi:hypothetical protein